MCNLVKWGRYPHCTGRVAWVETSYSDSYSTASSSSAVDRLAVVELVTMMHRSRDVIRVLRYSGMLGHVD